MLSLFSENYKLTRLNNKINSCKNYFGIEIYSKHDVVISLIIIFKHKKKRLNCNGNVYVPTNQFVKPKHRCQYEVECLNNRTRKFQLPQLHFGFNPIISEAVPTVTYISRSECVQCKIVKWMFLVYTSTKCLNIGKI